MARKLGFGIPGLQSLVCGELVVADWIRVLGCCLVISSLQHCMPSTTCSKRSRCGCYISRPTVPCASSSLLAASYSHSSGPSSRPLLDSRYLQYCCFAVTHFNVDSIDDRPFLTMILLSDVRELCCQVMLPFHVNQSRVLLNVPLVIFKLAIPVAFL